MSTEDKRRVLVFCQDAAMRLVLECVLASISCQPSSLSVTATQTEAGGESVALVVLVADDGNEDLAALVSLHRRGCHAPAVLLTHTPDLALRRHAAALGVVDIIRLPASPHTIATRLEATLHNHPPAPARPDSAAVLRAGGLTLQRRSGEVSAGHWTVHLTRREAAVLAALMRRPGQVCHRHDLVDAVWGDHYTGDANCLDVYVARLRAKLLQAAPTRAYVRTVRGQGYCFDARAKARVSGAVPPIYVCVVDDGSPLIPTLATILRDAGCEIVTSPPQESAALARRLQPAALLLHVPAREAEALRVRGQVAADPSTAHIPLIALGPREVLFAPEAALAAAEVVPTPLDHNEVRLRVMRIVEARRQTWTTARATSA